MKERGRVRTMNEVLKDVDWDFKETGTMANLMSTEEFEKLEEAKRNERVAIERGRHLEDLLHKSIGDVADARASVHRLSKHGVELENKLCHAGSRMQRARGDFVDIRGVIEKLHYKTNPRHFKTPKHNCDWCAVILRLVRAAQEAGR